MPPAIAELIRTGRIRKGLNQEDLAQKSGVSRTTLHHIERGTHKPRASTLSRLAKTLDIDPHSLAQGWQRESPNGAAGTNPSVIPAVDHSGLNGHTDAVHAAVFDRSTNLALAAAREQSPERFADFRTEDWDALASQVGVGGGLTPEGVYRAADQIRRDRETLSRLRMVLQTHLREPARKLVDALYQSIVIESEPPADGTKRSESPRSE